MMRLKSQSLPETENTKVEFGLVAEGNLSSLSPNRISMQRSNSALPQSSKEMRTAGKNAAEEKKSKGAKRWKILRLLTLVAKRDKHGRKRTDSTKTIDGSEESFSPLNDEEFSFDGANSVKEIRITKPEEDKQKESENNVQRQESTSSEKRIMWDEESITESPSRKISEGQYVIANAALANAVGKWKESIRPSAPELYESGKGVPRRLGVCEELEKTVVNDGTSLHELRKDLTVYLTLDELGML